MKYLIYYTTKGLGHKNDDETSFAIKALWFQEEREESAVVEWFNTLMGLLSQVQVHFMN